MPYSATSIIYQNVNKNFGDKMALNDISLSIKDGEFMVFVGPSGSGKSTLLRILAGLETIDSGHIIIDGRDVTMLPPKQRDLAMVFQNYALYPHMSIKENIIFGMKIRKESRENQENALSHVVSLLQLEGLLDRKPRQLSGGQRQRVAMARAIVRNPRAFLMDEPLSNLDARLRNEVRSAIIEQQRILGTTTVYVTHDQVEAMTMAHRIVVLNQGVIQQIGTPEDLYTKPNNMFVAGFIGNPGMNFIPALSAGGQFKVKGDQISVKIPEPLSMHTKEGKEFSIGIRPEDFRLARNDDQSQFSLRGHVVGREMTGAEYILQLKITEGVTIQTRIPTQQDIPHLGETATFYTSSKKLHYFSASNGQCIANADNHYG